MDNKLHILQHSLGLDQYGQGSQYRNRFITGEDTSDFPDCRMLVADGLMTERSGNITSGGDSIFQVTQKGIEFVAQNSSPVPKLTRSQRRYLEYLRYADMSGMSFREWLGIKSRV